jgi:hypothetical protein
MHGNGFRTVSSREIFHDSPERQLKVPIMHVEDTLVRDNNRPLLQNQNTVAVTVSVTEALREQLGAFLERIVSIMITAPEDGADGATRAFAALRPLQIRLGRAELGEELTFEMTYHGARSTVREIGSFLGRQATQLEDLRHALIVAMRERDSAARHATDEIRRQRSFR